MIMPIGYKKCKLCYGKMKKKSYDNYNEYTCLNCGESFRIYHLRKGKKTLPAKY